jgi:long-chain acyl-CoA synthetase
MGLDAANRDWTIPKLFMRNVGRYGDRVALREKDLGIWQRISWNDYWTHVRDFALGLLELGFLDSRGNISILGDNTPEWLYADLAAQSLRAVSVGVYPTNVAEQVHYVLENSDTSFVVCGDQEQVDKILEIKDRLPLLKKIIVVDMKGLRTYGDPMIISFEAVERLGEARHQKDPEEFDRLVEATRPEDVGVMVYTSGTTGHPKGAMITQRNMVAMIDGLSQVMPLSDRDTLVSALPLCHIAERSFSLIFPMWAGCTINFAESVATLQDDLREISPTAFLSVPRIWEKMHSTIYIKIKDAMFLKRWVFLALMPVGLRVAGLRLTGRPVPWYWRLLRAMGHVLLFRALVNSLGLLNGRTFFSGAAPLSHDLLRFYHAIGVPVRECFGMTECAGMSVIPAADGVRIGQVGYPIPGMELKLAEDGEIMLRGDAVFKGYYRLEAESVTTFTDDGWLLTGDVGEFSPEGQLRIVDRKKDLIINAYGKNIAPSEIENKLKFSPFVKEAVVIGDGRQYLVCLIQLELDNVSDWAQERGIAFTTYKSLAENEAVHGLIQQEVDRVNQTLARVEQIKKFTILTKELDQDDDEVTATMKVRRSTIEKKFGDLIQAMY